MGKEVGTMQFRVQGEQIKEEKGRKKEEEKSEYKEKMRKEKKI
jgi:hypothetical protein